VIEGATAPEATATVPAKTSRVWRIVGIVVAFQALIVLAGVLLFSAMGLANDGVGSCGGG
jgi:hypothetical protein